jgi:pSer/pThr/pTyr-binding forkhead associated (FHA) protein
MNTRLVSARGAPMDLAFALQGRRVTIGREDDNMVQLPHEEVSKHHAVLLAEAAGWVIEDLQSANGTLVNGKRVQRARLADGDSVKLGPFELFFEENAPSADWVPSHLLDLSSEVHDATIHIPKPPPKA